MHKSCFSVVNKFTNLIKEDGTVVFRILLQASFKCGYSQVLGGKLRPCQVPLKQFLLFFLFFVFCCSSSLFFRLSLPVSLDHSLNLFYIICSNVVRQQETITALQCDNCHLWVHIKCNRINLQTYKYLQKCFSAWYCLKWYEELIPFITISNKELYQTNQGEQIKFTSITKMVSPSQDLIDQLKDAMDDPMSENISTKY